MAYGDIIGDLGNAYLSFGERVAKAGVKQNSFDASNYPTGPVGRASQQLTNLNQSSPSGSAPTDATSPPRPLSLLSVSPPGAPQQPSDPHAQPQPTALADTGTDIGRNLIQNPQEARQQPSIQSLQDGFTYGGSQIPAPTSFAEIGGRINPSALDGSTADSQQLTTQSQSEPLAASGLASGLSFKPSQAPYPTSFAELGGSLDANKLGNLGGDASAASATTPAASISQAPLMPSQPAASNPLTTNQFIPVVGGSDTSDAKNSIVGKINADGTASFSNDKLDLKNGYGMAPVSAPRSLSLADQANIENAAGSGPSFAALGSAKNMGDGVGSFSRFNQGDAKLATERFQRAADLRQGYKEQDALARAQQQADIDSSVHTIRDSSRPITRNDLAQAQLDQQQSEGDQQSILNAQNGITSGQAQRAAALQVRQAQNLEDLRNAALAPDSTPEQQGSYQRAIDPTGAQAQQRLLVQAQIDEKNANAAKLRSTNRTGNLPVGLQKLEDGDIDAVSNVQSINTQMGNILKQFEDGSLVLGPVENRKNAALNAAGRSTPQSVNYASFVASLEKIRNDSLRLNKGPQTEGDANRAWNELVANANDQKVVIQRLKEIQTMNNRAAEVRLGAINNRRKNQGIGPLKIEDILGDTQQPTQNQVARPQQPQASSATTASKQDHSALWGG
jgi:hypothetical protein